MTGENATHAKSASPEEAGSSAERTDEYDPFARGGFPVGVRTVRAVDAARDRQFPCEIWYPASVEYAGQDIAPTTQDVFSGLGETRRSQMAVRDAAAQAGTYPLILFSHSTGGDRRQSAFLCTHLSSHGYLVAALDHSERVVAELARKDGESAAQKTSRAQAWIANRMPDVHFLLNYVLSVSDSKTKVDPTRIGIVGHSFGGWTALAAIDEMQDIRAVVALAPAGASQRKPGILPVELSFAWGRDVPTLYLVAENDTSLPLDGMYELFERTPATKQMVILRRADHAHFMDNAEELHEAFRTMPSTGELARIQKEMQPITDLCSGEQGYLFIRGLTTCHMDAILKGLEEARRFWIGDIKAELGKRGGAAMVR